MKRVVILLFALMFVLHQGAEQAGLHHALADSYLDDFTFLPLFLFTVETLTGRLAHTRFRLSLPQQLLLSAYMMGMAECVFPWLSSRFVFDPLDFVAYGCGYAVYWVSGEIKIAHNITSS